MEPLLVKVMMSPLLGCLVPPREAQQERLPLAVQAPLALRLAFHHVEAPAAPARLSADACATGHSSLEESALMLSYCAALQHFG